MKQLVLPGTILATEEEFLSGANSFAAEDGKIYSDAVGEKALDVEEKIANVTKKTRDISLLGHSMIVTGTVVPVKEQAVVLEILEAIDQKNPSKEIVFGNASASIPVFSVSREYVKFLPDLFKIADIVRARVENVSEAGTELETKSEPGLGIVLAYCTNCRAPLQLVESTLKCSSCGSNETRKLSADYMLK